MKQIISFIGLFFFLSIFSVVCTYAAEDILILQNDHQNRIIVPGLTGEDQTLFFGDALSHSLMWDDTNSYFSFSDDVHFSDNEIKSVRLENLATAPTCDGAVVGKIYYDTADSIPYACDGATWKKLATNIENAIIKTSLVGFSGGAVAENGSSLYMFNAQSSRTTTGQYSITFDSTHPNGTAYNIALSVQTDGGTRDQRKIQWLNKSSTGFDVYITIDDNGGTADTFADEKFDFTVFAQEDTLISE